MALGPVSLQEDSRMLACCYYDGSCALGDFILIFLVLVLVLIVCVCVLIHVVAAVVGIAVLPFVIVLMLGLFGVKMFV